ncbi:hypothetical protein [Streptomyces sp. NPDC127038]
MQVRPGAATAPDALTDPYDLYVRETPITFDTIAFTPEHRRPRLLPHT